MIELLGGEDGDVVDLLSVGEGLASEGLVTRPKGCPAPPAFLEIEPASTFRDEDVVNSRVSVQPLRHGWALVTGGDCRAEVNPL